MGVLAQKHPEKGQLYAKKCEKKMRQKAGLSGNAKSLGDFAFAPERFADLNPRPCDQEPEPDP